MCRIFRSPFAYVVIAPPVHARTCHDLGYALIGTESNGVNAFFLRGDCLGAAGFRELTPEEAFHPARYIGLHGQPGHRFRDGPLVPA